MFRELAASRWGKPGLLAVTLGFCGYGLLSERAQVAAALRHLAWYPVAGAVALYPPVTGLLLDHLLRLLRRQGIARPRPWPGRATPRTGPACP